MNGARSLADFTALVDSLPGLQRITLQGLGEPLLVPHLDGMVALAAGRGIAVGFNTNGTLLTRARANRLVRAGLASCGWRRLSASSSGCRPGKSPPRYRDFRAQLLSDEPPDVCRGCSSYRGVF